MFSKQLGKRNARLVFTLSTPLQWGDQGAWEEPLDCTFVFSLLFTHFALGRRETKAGSSPLRFLRWPCNPFLCPSVFFSAQGLEEAQRQARTLLACDGSSWRAGVLLSPCFYPGAWLGWGLSYCNPCEQSWNITTPSRPSCWGFSWRMNRVTHMVK